MRLAEEKIRQGILHPDPRVREHAVRHFADSFSPDPTVMPLLIRAAEQYGEVGTYSWLPADRLAQTDETLSWLLARLEEPQPDPAEEGVKHGLLKWGNRHFVMSRVVADADAELLARRRSDIMACPGVFAECRETIVRRIELLSEDPDRCWEQLEAICREGVDKTYLSEINRPEADRFVEAIARHPERYADRVLESLDVQVDDYEHDPFKWMEGFVIDMAGQMRLEPAVGKLAAKLLDAEAEDDDWILRECMDALARIGTDEVVRALTDSFAQRSWGYRITAAETLGKIHGDLTVEKLLDMLAHEEDPEAQDFLARAILDQYAFEAIEPVQELVLASSPHPERLDTADQFVAAATLMEVPCPDVEQWCEIARKRIESSPSPLLPGGLFDEWGDDDEDAEYDRYEPSDERGGRYEEVDAGPIPAPETIVRDAPRVGRNDPCPCGSGKKYKKCCLNKPAADVQL